MYLPTFVSTRKEKLLEFQLMVEFELPWQHAQLTEIQSDNPLEIAKLKVFEAYNKLQKPVWVEDTGLYFKAWNNLPGPFIKWFLKNIGTDGLCQMLSSFPNRRAFAKTAIATFDGVNYQVFLGVIHGEITLSPLGSQGFGWDSIFQPDGHNKTFGEMTREEKNSCSMRSLAFGKFSQYMIERKDWTTV